jgi:type I restriction enzyme S subunit
MRHSQRWATRTLVDLCDRARGITYGIVKVGEFVPDGIPVVRGGDVRDGWITVDHTKRVSREVSEKFRRTILRGGELVMNLIAEPGHAAVVPSEFAGYNVSRDVAVIPLGDDVDARFVSYFLRSQQCIDWLVARLQGSVTQKINLSTLRELPVPAPSLSAQRLVSDVLGGLDDKMEQNTQLSQKLTELIRLRGRHMLRTCAEASTPLSDVARFVNGRAFTKAANGAGRPIIRIRELNSGIDSGTPRTDLAVSDEHIARDGDLLFSWSGSLDLYRWIGPESVINQHIFKVLPSGYPTWLVELWISQHLPDFKAIAADKATTMGHIQRHHLDEALVAVPAASELFDATDLESADRMRISLLKMNKRLASVRDALLPKLVSGAIRVPDSDDPDDALGTVAEAASVALP